MRKLTAMDVCVQQVERADAWQWYGFMNKPVCLEWAERTLTTDRIVWLDSDLLVVRDAAALASADFEFAACARDRNIGTRGPDDENEPYWTAITGLFGMVPADLPNVPDHASGQPLRLYWNGGIFAYPRISGFSRIYRQAIERILVGRVAHRQCGVHFSEQIALGLAMLQSGLRWSPLPLELNTPIYSWEPDVGGIAAEQFEAAAVFHYHDSMSPSHWPSFLKKVRAARPDVADWLAHFDAIATPRFTPWRAWASVQFRMRARVCAAHLATCSRY